MVSGAWHMFQDLHFHFTAAKMINLHIELIIFRGLRVIEMTQHTENIMGEDSESCLVSNTDAGGLILLSSIRFIGERSLAQMHTLGSDAFFFSKAY